mmetsp:Transcript_61110/g.157587  ORF Transcript_61110/g.157587 Transcript_61110/m.157587 type:complete len:302 (+) Transcript_61110:112-1017(+)
MLDNLLVGSSNVEAGLTDSVLPLHVLVGNVVSIMLGLVGALLAAYVIWFFTMWGVGGTKDSMTVFEEAVIGFFLLAGITFVASGSASYYVNKMAATCPSASHFWKVGYETFDLYVTVHRAKNVPPPSGCDGFARTQGDHYMEVQCGRLMPGGFFSAQRNPAKRTCVSKKGIFEETFHFIITPTDDNLRFTLYNQYIIADELIGMCDLSIAEKVLNAGFPQKKAYTLHALHTKTDTKVIHNPVAAAGTMVVSFVPGDNCPWIASVKRNNDLAYDNLQTMQEERKKRFESVGGASMSYKTFEP